LAGRTGIETLDAAFDGVAAAQLDEYV